MPTTCDTASETFHISDRLMGSSRGVAQESFGISDALRPRFTTHVSDGLAINDSAFGNAIAIARESFSIHATIAVHDHGANVARETFWIRSAVDMFSRNVCSESFTITDRVYPSANRDVAREAFTIGDIVVDRNVGGARAREQLFIADRAVAQVLAKLSETFTVSDHVSGPSHPRDIARESFTVHAAAPHHGSINIAREALPLIIHSAISARSASHNIARETLYVDDALEAKGDGTAWAASTDTYAMSRYAWNRQRGIGVIDGRLVLAGDGGFYELTGADDNGAKVAALVTGGLIDIGVPSTRDQNARETGDQRLKRTHTVIIGYKGGPFEFGVGETGHGVESRYWYPFIERDATDFCSSKAKLGRGLRSRYWRFLLRNVDGAGGMVKEQRVIVESTSRSV
jgi:hypothetical protein